MIIVYDSLNKMETTLAVFFKNINHQIEKKNNGNQYLYLSEDLSQISVESIFPILSNLGISIPPNSPEMGTINTFVNNSNFLFPKASFCNTITKDDIIAAPFFNMSDYPFLKELEKKCPNIVCLSSNKPEIKLDDNDKIYDLSPAVDKVTQCFNENVFAQTPRCISNAQKLLKEAFEKGLSFTAYQKQFQDYLQSLQLSEEQEKEQMRRICNLKTYFK